MNNKIKNTPVRQAKIMEVDGDENLRIDLL